MERKHWILLFVAVLSALAVSDYLFMHVLFPLKRAALLEQRRSSEPENVAPPATPATDAPKSDETRDEPATGGAAVPGNHFASAARDCIGLSASGPDELIDSLERNRLEEKEIGLENWHVRRPDGREERVMLVDSDRGNANGKKELRLFGVDDEGLPIPRELDPRVAFDPSPRAIASLRRPGEVFFHQTQESLKFRDGLSAEVERVNDRVREMRVTVVDGSTLACRGSDCRCL